MGDSISTISNSLLQSLEVVWVFTFDRVSIKANIVKLYFIKKITQKSPNNVGVSFINKKAPVRRLFEPEALNCGL